MPQDDCPQNAKLWLLGSESTRQTILQALILPPSTHASSLFVHDRRSHAWPLCVKSSLQAAATHHHGGVQTTAQRKRMTDGMYDAIESSQCCPHDCGMRVPSTVPTTYLGRTPRIHMATCQLLHTYPLCMSILYIKCSKFTHPRRIHTAAHIGTYVSTPFSCSVPATASQPVSETPRRPIPPARHRRPHAHDFEQIRDAPPPPQTCGPIGGGRQGRAGRRW